MFRQALTSAPAPCISPDLVCSHTRENYNVAPVTGESVPSTTSQRRPTSPDSHRRMRATSSSTSSSSSSFSPPPYPLPFLEPQPTKSSHLIAYTRRNAPALPSDTTPSPVARRRNRWACPHCPYVQHNRRAPDFKRHLKTHTHGADVALWVCCGVYAPDAMDHGVPAEVLRQGEIIEFDGLQMIGGCRKTFSRRDALIRHLKARKGRCFGDALSMHQPGNRLELEEL